MLPVEDSAIALLLDILGLGLQGTRVVKGKEGGAVKEIRRLCLIVPVIGVTVLVNVVLYQYLIVRAVSAGLGTDFQQAVVLVVLQVLPLSGMNAAPIRSLSGLAPYCTNSSRAWAQLFMNTSAFLENSWV